MDLKSPRAALRPSEMVTVMHAKPDIRSIATQMKAAQDGVCQIRPFTSGLDGLDISSAYEVSHLIHGDRLAEGSVAVGRKIGFTNAEMWAVYGVHEPIWAYLYDTTVAYLPLQANEMVTTGTVTAAQAVHSGETWRTEIEGIALPGLSVTFVD